MGVGALTDFGPMLRNLRLSIFGAAAQFGIFAVLLVAILMASRRKRPLARYHRWCRRPDGHLHDHQTGPTLARSYRHCSLFLHGTRAGHHPLVVKLTCTKKELMINMKEQEKLHPSTTEIKNLRVLKIIFPIAVTTVVACSSPRQYPSSAC